MRVFSIIGFVFVLVGWIWWQSRESQDDSKVPMYYGVNLESPPRPIDSATFASVLNIHPSHVSIIPYGFSRSGEPEVYYDQKHHWWGESYEGVAALVTMARQQELSVMLKPHVWIANEGWPGDYKLLTESDWRIWEQSYEKYIMGFASVADSLGIELFCIGTEYRKAVVERPDFWIGLIQKVRNKYKGKITYAANWDNYQNVSFWKELDYIGIDAYFPLDTSQTPSPQRLQEKWEPIIDKLADFSSTHDRSILFTEYGYQSICHTTGPHWENEGHSYSEHAQQVAYQVMYDQVWDQSWFAGGFLWKWRYYDEVGGKGDKGFTPQGKAAINTISSFYQIDGLPDDGSLGR